MADKENVIKGLETCSDVYYGADGACSSCPYSQTNGDRCLAELVHDAIAMLKQEAVKPTWSRGRPCCGSCGLQIRNGGKFCSECGKPIAWEGR